LTGGIGGLWGTPAALVMNGAVALGAEAVAAIAGVLRGAVPGAGPGRRGGQPSTCGDAGRDGPGATLRFDQEPADPGASLKRVGDEVDAGYRGESRSGRRTKPIRSYSPLRRRASTCR